MMRMQEPDNSLKVVVVRNSNKEVPCLSL